MFPLHDNEIVKPLLLIYSQSSLLRLNIIKNSVHIKYDYEMKS